jgi:hypothetical protein
MEIFPNGQLSGSKFPDELDEILGSAREQSLAFLGGGPGVVAGYPGF